MTDDVRSAVRRGLGGQGDRARAVEAALVELEVPITALEASVRGGDGPIRGARMMIEGLAPGAARGLLEAIAPETPAAVWQEILDAAARLTLGLIVGWDAGSGPPTAKAYLNASDAAPDVRAAAREALVPGAGAIEAPHVIGLNVRGEVVERKLYEQRASLPAEAPRALHDWIAAAGAPVAGAVVSHRIDPAGPAPKAYFAALRPLGEARDRLLSMLPGWDEAAVAAASPFPAGLLTSLGFATSGESWTVYFKPLEFAGVRWQLDPAACFTDGESEVGVYLEPAHLAERAYATAGGHAVSYRVRRGSPPEREVARLMDWAVGVIRERGPAHLTSPPRPWNAVAPS